MSPSNTARYTRFQLHFQNLSSLLHYFVPLWRGYGLLSLDGADLHCQRVWECATLFHGKWNSPHLYYMLYCIDAFNMSCHKFPSKCLHINIWQFSYSNFLINTTIHGDIVRMHKYYECHKCAGKKQLTIILIVKRSEQKTIDNSNHKLYWLSIC